MMKKFAITYGNKPQVAEDFLSSSPRKTARKRSRTAENENVAAGCSSRVVNKKNFQLRSRKLVQLDQTKIKKEGLCLLLFFSAKTRRTGHPTYMQLRSRKLVQLDWTTINKREIVSPFLICQWQERAETNKKRFFKYS